MNYIQSFIFNRYYPLPVTTQDIINRYYVAREKGEETIYISDLLTKIQGEIKSHNVDNLSDIIQQLVFLNLLGYDISWADFDILDVMSFENYSSKLVAYTCASQSWTSHSEAVLMGINRFHRDLTSTHPLVPSAVLSSIVHFLTPQVAQNLAADVISLMTSSKPIIRKKAIIVFYHFCFQFPKVLPAGIAVLRARLDDHDSSVVFSALAVFKELVRQNPQSFVSLIPKFFKMLETSTTHFMTLYLIQIMRNLCEVEPRLPKKLVIQLTIILETTPSVTVLFECVRTVLEVPLTASGLLDSATCRIQAFLSDINPNLRYVSITQFFRLMKIQPRLVVQYREIIFQCLDSTDENQRLIALDLLAALANAKTIDGIVAKIFEHYKNAKTESFRNQLIIRVIDICQKNDYDLVNDFDWYISVLMDFIDEGGFSCYDVFSHQFLDLADRIPAIRNHVVTEMGNIFDNSNYSNATDLLLVASYIISEYSTDSLLFPKVLQPMINNCNDRVQASCIATAFKLYLKCQTEEEFLTIEDSFDIKLPLFLQSTFPEIRERASTTLILVHLLKADRTSPTFNEIKGKLTAPPHDMFDVLEPPLDLQEPLPKYFFEDEPIIKVEKQTKRVNNSKPNRRKHKHHEHRHKTVILDSPSLQQKQEDEKEEKDEKKTEKKPQLNIQNLPPMIRRSLRKKNNMSSDKLDIESVELPVTGPVDQARVQQIGKSEHLVVYVTDYSVNVMEQNYLEVTIQIQNNSPADIPSIDLSLVPITNFKVIKIPSLHYGVDANSSILATFIIDVTNYAIPQIAKLLIVPNGGGVEIMETKLRIFPSYFLIPADADVMELAESRCTFSKSLKAQSRVSKRNMLQSVVNTLRSNIIRSQDDGEQEVLFSKSVFGDYIICNYSFIENIVQIEIKTSNDALSTSLIREIELALKSL